jgi:hypothetical protein
MGESFNDLTELEEQQLKAITRLLAENKILEEAVKFYAAKRTWSSARDELFSCHEEGYLGPTGKLARETLAKIQELRGGK